jgi:hypothetical protein
MYNQDQVVVFNVALLRGNAGLTAAAMYIMREDMAYRVVQAVQEAVRSLAKEAGGQRRHVYEAHSASTAVFADLRWSDVTKLAEYLHSNPVAIREAVSRRLAIYAAIEGSGRGDKTQLAEFCPSQLRPAKWWAVRPGASDT